MPFGRHPLKMVCLPISPLPHGANLLSIAKAGIRRFGLRAPAYFKRRTRGLRPKCLSKVMISPAPNSNEISAIRCSAKPAGPLRAPSNARLAKTGDSIVTPRVWRRPSIAFRILSRSHRPRSTQDNSARTMRGTNTPSRERACASAERALVACAASSFR